MNFIRQNESPLTSDRRRDRGVGVGLSLLTVLLAVGATVPAALPDPFTAPPASGAKVGVVSPAVDAAGFHTFNDNQGHAFKAKVLGLVNTTVTLQRDDGEKVQVAMSSLNKSDQNFIIESVVKLNTTRGQPVFELSAVTEKSNPAPSKIEGGTRMSWQENYRLTIKNQTLLAMGNLQARIIIFKALRVPDVPGGVTSSVMLLHQTQDVSPVPGNGKTVIQTEPVAMEQILANDGGQFPGAPAVHMQTDKLMAVWVRLYNSDNHVIREWCSMPSLTKQQTWDAAWELAGGDPPKAQ